MPITSSITAAMPPLPAPPGSPGTVNPRIIWLPDGCAIRYSGMSSSEPAQNVIATRSNARKLPVNAVAMITPAAKSTATTFGTPR